MKVTAARHGLSIGAALALSIALAAPAAQPARDAGDDSMARIKGGCFDMGHTFGGYADAGDKPAHRVCVDDFSLDRYEVTNAAFERYKPGFRESRRARRESAPENVSPGDRNPVVNVTWFEAEGYCRSVGKRLPTEAEWEYAARNGGRNVRYPTGRDAITTAEANFGGDDRGYFYDAAKFKGRTMPVGSYPPSELGLHDMSGNVAEWMADWFDELYYRNSPQQNPKGPASGTCRSIRGGAWDSSSDVSSVSSRTCGRPEFRVDDVGIRCAK